ncbi:Nucleolar protein 14 [Melipona quadrifasciata]|uniref:Nucleolar protein 14 n=1 Tax=Melipona quadrifasciata TaxID=166423 RepID=A0A0M9A990_9HYME|nr:Nucleolar protein 14 [Melipona quadrifasciata]
MVKIKKKLLSEISQEKRSQEKKKSLNPFEVHINRDKQNVLGRKSKADKGLPGVSRAKAIKKRKDTLLQEYKLKHKSNLFLDRRIGEKNSFMNEEDKALARFTAERIKAHKKKSIYNLNDEEVLTHRGQTLEEIEKFDDPKSDDEYSDNENGSGKLDNKFVNEAHFGGGVLSKSESGKSRKDLIDELIAESKKRKAERQKIREQTIDLTEKLDSEWRDLLPIVSAANKNVEETTVHAKTDDYDIAVRELKFEAKGTPSDKLKSEEEIVKEEKEKLETLEADRVARMQGLINTNNTIKHKSADDLDDGFTLETINDEILPKDKENSIKNAQEVNATKVNGMIRKEKSAENSNEETSESENPKDNFSDLEETESSSEEENELNKSNMTINLKEQKIRNDLLKREKLMESIRKELSYTFEVPESFAKLQEILQNYDADCQSIIHINDHAMENDIESVIKGFQIIDRLSPFLYDLAHLNPQNSSSVIQEIIKEKHKNFEKNKKKYPDLDTLVFFKLVSLLFPTSDFRHPVTTPSLIFMSQILFRCRVKNKVDISKGLFICTLILEYTILSKRFAPSVINFLRGIIHISTPKYLIQGIKIIPPFKTIGESSNLLVLDEDQTNLDINLSSIHMKASDLVNDDFRIRALLIAVNLLREFKNYLEELEAAYSIFEPILKLLKLNSFNMYPSSLKKHIKQLRKDLKKLKNKKLEYIVVEKKKPKPLRLYEPRIEAVYDSKKHKPMSKEKAEREKLLHKYKKEMKGAMREIRRDRAFLAKLQIKQQIKNDEERKRKVKEIFGEAAMQQSELKKLKRKK